MQVKTDIDLSKKTSFGIGCIVPICYFPETIEDVIWCKKKFLNAPIIGEGTKVLVNDKANIPVLIDMSEFDSSYNVEDSIVFVKSGMKTRDLVTFLYNVNLSGLEFLAGVPGLIGGAVIMNAGTCGKNISKFVQEVNIINELGEVEILKNKELKFKRRYSTLQNKKVIVISVKLKLDYINIQNTYDVLTSYIKEREKLPKGKSAGGIFINHHILKNYNLDGFSYGDAYLKGNFIINKGKATTQDILNLIRIIKNTVKEPLELELQLIGCKEIEK